LMTSTTIGCRCVCVQRPDWAHISSKATTIRHWNARLLIYVPFVLNCTQTHSLSHTHTHTHTRTCANTCTCTNTQTQSRTHTRTQIHTRTCTPLRLKCFEMVGRCLGKHRLWMH
jgi:hypothetical protein